MSKKAMTIPEFLEMYRIKEFNAKRSNKRLLILVMVLILLGITVATESGLSASESITAFQLDNINLLR
jgi:hypothetical protein